MRRLKSPPNFRSARLLAAQSSSVWRIMPKQKREALQGLSLVTARGRLVCDNEGGPDSKSRFRQAPIGGPEGGNLLIMKMIGCHAEGNGMGGFYSGKGTDVELSECSAINNGGPVFWMDVGNAGAPALHEKQRWPGPMGGFATSVAGGVLAHAIGAGLTGKQRMR
jgi:hypothetical protein